MLVNIQRRLGKSELEIKPYDLNITMNKVSKTKHFQTDKTAKI